MTTDTRSLVALLRMETRRIGRRFRTGLVSAAVVTVGFAYLGDFTRTGIAMALLAPVAMFLLQPWSFALEDRTEGGLELLTQLPVAPSVLTRARIVTTAVLVLPAAAALTAALILAPLPGLAPGPSGAGVAGAFVVVWMALSGLALALAGQMIRFGPQPTMGLPLMVLLAASVVYDEVATRIWDDPSAIFASVVGHPWFPGATVCLVVAASLILGGVGVGLLASGFDHFEPGADRVPRQRSSDR